MAYTWNATFEGQPADAETPASGDNRIRAFKIACRERMGNEHTEYIGDATAGAYLLDWNHVAGSAKGYFQNAAPVNRPNGSTALTADDKGRFWFDDDNGDVLNFYDGTNWVGIIRELCRFTIQGSLAVGQDIIPPLIFPRGCTILKVSAYVGTAPVGAALQIDLEIDGAAGTSIFAATFSIADGAQTANTETFANDTLAADERLHVDIDQVGSTTPGADLSLTVEVLLG